MLVSILGDFHSSIFPIFFEFKDSIDTHIVVHDDAFSEQSKSNKVITSLKQFSYKNSLDINTQDYKIDEDSLASILKLIEHIKSTANSLEDIYINTTDGLSNIGVVLGAKLLDSGAKLLSYDMYENSYNLTSRDSIYTKQLNSKMSIKEHFLFKGLKVADLEDKEFAHKYEPYIRDLFENHYDEFVIMKRDVTSSTKSNQHQYPNALELIKRMNLNVKTQQKSITGGLFEFYTYLLVKDLGFDDIEIGIVIEDAFSNNTSVRNEFDLLLMKDNHLHMIECKFTKNIDMQALVYKYSSLINLIDDDGRIIILTDKAVYSHDLYDSTKLGLEHHRRALVNKILVRGSILKNKNGFIDDVKSYLNLH
ncbi:MAG: hypothetical protein DRG78_14315 [Epsilonproteobacteria bacterium]|nr:MAG: hypothetical protein DRG78_14315 [Campylobacterota bacterium]